MSLSRRKLVNLVSVLVISLFLFSISVPFVQAAIGDSMDTAIGSVKEVLEPVGELIKWLFETEITRIVLVCIFMTIMLYAIFDTGISKIPAFADGDARKKGRLIAISLAILSALGIYYMVEQNGGIKTVLETFGNLGILLIALAVGMGMFTILKEANPDAKPMFKFGIFMLSAGLAYYFFGKWIDLELSDLGMGLIVFGAIFMLLGMGKKGSAGGAGSGVGGALGGVGNFFRGVGSGIKGARDRRDRRLTEKHKNGPVTKKLVDSMHHLKMLLADLETREKVEKEHFKEEADFLNNSREFAQKLERFVKFLPGLSLQDLFNHLENDKGVESAIKDMINNISKKESKHEKQDKTHNTRIIKDLKKVVKDLKRDEHIINSASDDLNKKFNYYDQKRKDEASQAMEEYKKVLTELNENKIITKKILELERQIQSLQKENIELVGDKKTRLGELQGELVNIKGDIGALQKEIKHSKDPAEVDKLKEKTQEHIKKLEEKMSESLSHLEEDILNEQKHLEQQESLLRQLDQFKLALLEELGREEEEIESFDKFAEKIDTENKNIYEALEPVEKKYDELDTEVRRILDPVHPIFSKTKALDEDDIRVLNEAKESLQKVFDEARGLTEAKNSEGQLLLDQDPVLKSTVQQLGKDIENNIAQIDEKLKESEATTPKDSEGGEEKAEELVSEIEKEEAEIESDLSGLDDAFNVDNPEHQRRISNIIKDLTEIPPEIVEIKGMIETIPEEKKPKFNEAIERLSTRLEKSLESFYALLINGLIRDIKKRTLVKPEDRAALENEIKTEESYRDDIHSIISGIADPELKSKLTALLSKIDSSTNIDEALNTANSEEKSSASAESKVEDAESGL
jgi:chromosome segregation ATPase